MPTEFSTPVLLPWTEVIARSRRFLLDRGFRKTSVLYEADRLFETIAALEARGYLPPAWEGIVEQYGWIRLALNKLAYCARLETERARAAGDRDAIALLEKLDTHRRRFRSGAPRRWFAGY